MSVINNDKQGNHVEWHIKIKYTNEIAVKPSVVSITCHYKDTMPLRVSLHNKKQKQKQTNKNPVMRKNEDCLNCNYVPSVTQSGELKLDDGTNH